MNLKLGNDMRVLEVLTGYLKYKKRRCRSTSIKLGEGAERPEYHSKFLVIQYTYV